MTCTNPNCRHRTKRQLRPLVISLIPSNANINNDVNSRHEQITQMFTTHTSLAAHFEPPVFSPGVQSRELRGRLKFLEHANRAGLIPDIEWKAICKGLREQCTVDSNDDDDNSMAEDISPILSELHSLLKSAGGRENEKQTVIDPFRYLATETLIQPEQPSNDDGNSNDDDNNNHNNLNSTANEKKKHWLQYKTTSLIPISPDRQGSLEDISVPVSVELWRKAKTLNRDRSVLACTLAHLMAMKTLVGEKKENDAIKQKYILMQQSSSIYTTHSSGKALTTKRYTLFQQTCIKKQLEFRQSRHGNTHFVNEHPLVCLVGTYVHHPQLV